jgi:predicted  nucleic acid-binding Zn-ribbon protein
LRARLRAKVFNLHDLYDLEVLRAVSLEERVARIEGILEQVDKRLNHLESEVRELRSEMRGEIGSLRGEISGVRSELGSEIRELRRDLNNRFFWLLGVQISMWVTIILAVLIK